MDNPYFWFIALGTIWGSNFIFMKMAVSVIDPLQVVWFRVLAGAIPLCLYSLAKKELRWTHLKNSHHFLAMAVFANVLPFYFLVKGTQLLRAGIAGVISGTIPLMTIFIAAFFVPEEHFSRSRVLGLLVGFTGVALVAEIWTKISGLQRDLAGVSFIILGSASYAVAFIYAKKFVSRLAIRATPLATYQTLFASLLLTAITNLEGAGKLLSQPQALMSVILGLGLFGTGIAYMIYYYIIDRLGAVTASSVTYIPPIVALLFGTLFLGEEISSFQIVGTTMILLGIFFARGRSSNERMTLAQGRACT